MRCVGGLAALLLWLLALHGAGLYLFTTGFFLTRFEVPDVSTCVDRPTTATTTDTGSKLRGRAPDAANDATAEKRGCWMPRRFRRAVFVVIDALRFDFVRSPEGPDAPAGSSFYRGHLPVLASTLARAPGRSLLLKFVADPPTMTMQRLKGLTTGGLPTFLDIKDNMQASARITEDNLLRQLQARGRPVVFMGDDTWDALYGGLFARAFAFDSFNVKDLHSVDRGVIRHLFPELTRPHTWDLLIAHFLGVDHVGHTHGPSSPFMADKLREMDGVLGRLLSALDDDPAHDDTLLVVLGDHGMSADGNHGGASDDETGAALFLYSRRPLVAPRSTTNSSTTTTSSTSSAWPEAVPQVDLVPTLALLLGLPIPFGNLGAVIPQLFVGAANRNATTNPDDDHEPLAPLNEALRLNVAQVRRYLLRYSSASKLPVSEYAHLEKLHGGLVAAEDALRVARDPDDRAKLRARLAGEQQRFLREALALGRALWTQFDLPLMVWGVVVLALGLASTALALASTDDVDDLDGHGDKRDEDERTPPLAVASTVARASALGLAVGLAISMLLDRHLLGLLRLPRSPLGAALAGASLGGALVFLHRRLSAVGKRRRRRPWPRQFSSPAAATVVATVSTLLHCLALLSNSFIVAEARVMNFLVATTGCFLLWRALRSGESARDGASTAALCFLVLSRVLGGGLDAPNIIHATTSIQRTWLPLVAAAVLALGAFGWCGRRPMMTAAGPVLGALAAVAAYWWGTAAHPSVYWRLWLPRGVFLGVGAALACVWTTGSGGADDRLCGLLGLVAVAHALVLGPTSPISVLALVLQHASFARATRSPPPPLPAVALGLLWGGVCVQGFFATGHENTFSSLQNAAGFVGLDEFSFYPAGALLGLNTFGAYALGLVTLPRVLLPRTGSSWGRAGLGVLAFFSLQALVSAIFVGLQRRHLMVWAIFAPKFVFDGITLLLVNALLLLVTRLIGQ